MPSYQIKKYPVPDHVLAKIAELELKYNMTSAEYMEKERTGEDVPHNAETHWWRYWMYNILTGNQCYHPDTPIMRGLWADMLERGDAPFHPPIHFEFKPEFAVMTKEEMLAKLVPSYGRSYEAEQAAKKQERKRRKKARAEMNAAKDWQPDVLPFVD